jgi:putative Holliday junction resolvase
LAETEEELLVNRIIAVAMEYQVGGIVVGIPRPLSGGTNQQMDTVLAFVRRLEHESPVSVCTWDERFTSVLAERGLTGNEPRDAIAACYMLQGYLDTLADDPGGG